MGVRSHTAVLPYKCRSRAPASALHPMEFINNDAGLKRSYDSDIIPHTVDHSDTEPVGQTLAPSGCDGIRPSSHPSTHGFLSGLTSDEASPTAAPDIGCQAAVHARVFSLLDTFALVVAPSLRCPPLAPSSPHNSTPACPPPLLLLPPPPPAPPPPPTRNRYAPLISSRRTALQI